MINLWVILTLLAAAVALVIAWPFSREKKLNTIATVVMILFIPGVSLLWYNHFGASQKLAERKSIEKQIAMAKNEIQQMGAPKKLISKLEQHMQQHPKDAKGWYLLGKVYLDTADHQKAEKSFSTAHELEPKNTEYKVLLAQAMFLSNDRKLPKKAVQLLTDVLAQEPDNSHALNLLAVNDYLVGKYKRAISRWKLLLTAYDPDSDDGKMLRMMIEKAENKLNGSGIPTAMLGGK